MNDDTDFATMTADRLGYLLDAVTEFAPGQRGLAREIERHLTRALRDQEHRDRRTEAVLNRTLKANAA